MRPNAEIWGISRNLYHYKNLTIMQQEQQNFEAKTRGLTQIYPSYNSSKKTIPYIIFKHTTRELHLLELYLSPS